MILTFSVLHYHRILHIQIRLGINFSGPNLPFLGKFCPENSNYLYKLKFCTKYNLRMLNLMVMFTFSVSDWKHLFGANLSQKFKFVCMWLNLVYRIIQICEIR